MNKELLSSNINKKKANFNRNLCFFRSFILGVLFFFSDYLCAQEGFGNNQQTIIVVKGGAEIFSADENFNHQIINNNAVKKNIKVDFKKNGSEKLILLASEKEENQQDDTFKNQLAKVEKKKQKEALKEIKSKIRDYESRKENFDNKNLRVFPSSEKFIISSRINQDYVIPNYSQRDFSEINTDQNQYIVKSALDFLHSQKYTYYNNKSLDFCFSQVFSVRPPPVAI
ncbi:hypothetical protein [Chryseobacterium luquanense]|uniref:Uncharacterized protein n=1 Tax=Chryseobacterium luquanense TaxID=2983766 RepID=A0ABT3Y6N1_9FLAO|nr:hypothetical protein [Chryseobacterium luquanense]MCX8533819.1 hypothetical protein [Chryseobacterium luquanense]